jgi:hypothetical protein
MSEYRYYEFRAIDRPLATKEMAELRSYSTRARITPTSFTNEYAWGSFKGNADAWMERYFDAFLYLANCGTHVLKLRLPSKLLNPATARRYFDGGSASVHEVPAKVILSLVSQDEEAGEWVEGEGQLSSLISVRSELARGDLRALYLGWLLRVQAGELDDKDVEPPVPPGLGQPSASLMNLADFLRIDHDLLHVAIANSRRLRDIRLDRDEVRAWIGRLASEEKDELIADLLVDGGQAVAAELMQRLLAERSTGSTMRHAGGRTVGEILRAAAAYTKERELIEAEQRAQEKARRDREAAIAREKYLDSLKGREPGLWAEIADLVATRQPKCYDRAVKILLDLRDLDARGGGGDFRMRLETFLEAHARRPSFMARVREAGCDAELCGQRSGRRFSSAGGSHNTL